MDQGLLGLPTPAFVHYGVLLRRTSTISVTNNTLTSVSWEAVDQDSHGFMCQKSSFPTRILLPFPGVVVFTSFGIWAANNSNLRMIAVRKNGITYCGRKCDRAAEFGTHNHTAPFMDLGAAGDYYELILYQSSGGSLNFNSGSLTMEWLGAPR